MRLLFVASDPMEFRGILACTQDHRLAPELARWARAARLGTHEVLLAANGVGWRQSAAAVDSAYATFHPDAVISTGFCGGLDPRLSACEIVVANCILPCGAKARTFQAEHTGPIASVDHVVQTAAEKRALHAKGAIAVEMEAAGVAARAEALNLPFYCVRTVTDTASEELTNDFNSALRPDGHFDTMTIFRYALRHPVARFPELIRLRRICERAARTLGEFFADCRL